MNKKGTQIPGKIYHDAGTNLPILIISDGDYGKDIEKYFDKYNRFRFCSNVTDDICSTLEEMINDYSLLNPLKEFDRLEIAKSFINIIS
jgi:hypothetical protein